jgi:hypothetical protein
MNYSKAHQNFSNELQNPEALKNPQNFLGPNYETVLNFWWFMDGLTENQWDEVARRYDAPDYATYYAARNAAGNAARYAAGAAAGNAAWYAAGYAASDRRVVAAAGAATYELMGMHKLFERGDSLTFVPLFDFTGNYELHNLDVKDIETRIQRINDFIGPKVKVENDVSMTEEDLKFFIEDVELFD